LPPPSSSPAPSPSPSPSPSNAAAESSSSNAAADSSAPKTESSSSAAAAAIPVTPPPSREADDDRSYRYPALPLPYAQRKRLSDNLFTLSKEMPKLTDECALVLREARERDMWDCAVAELMTQVVVAVFCPEGDDRLEGLRRYLLSLGIAC